MLVRRGRLGTNLVRFGGSFGFLGSVGSRFGFWGKNRGSGGSVLRFGEPFLTFLSGKTA